MKHSHDSRAEKKAGRSYYMKISRRSTVDYTLIFLLLVCSGNPAAAVWGKETAYVFLFLLSLAAWCYRGSSIRRRDVSIIILFGCILAYHIVEFGAVVAWASAGYLLTILLAVTIGRAVEDPIAKYVSILTCLSILSLVFYVPSILIDDLERSLTAFRVPLAENEAFHIFLHNFHTSEETRNSGMFWEPGAFAGYLVLALIAVVARDDISKFKLGVLLAALITTQSTTGYVGGVAVLIIWAGVGLARRKMLAAFVLVVPIVIGVAVALYYNVDFLGSKIEAQFENASVGAARSEINRFGNVIYDARFILERPLLGWGGNPETRFSVDPELVELIAAQGNGLTGFAVKFGIFGLLVYLMSAYLGLRAGFQSNIVAGAILLVLLLLLMGEQFLNFPFFWVLPFLDRPRVGPPGIGRGRHLRRFDSHRPVRI